jgi:hypothetical protein
MFVERNVCYSTLFTNLIGWHAGAVSFPLSDIILAQLACPLSDIMFCLHSGITNLSLYKHWSPQQQYWQLKWAHVFSLPAALVSLPALFHTHFVEVDFLQTDTP